MNRTEPTDPQLLRNTKNQVAKEEVLSNETSENKLNPQHQNSSQFQEQENVLRKRKHNQLAEEGGNGSKMIPFKSEDVMKTIVIKDSEIRPISEKVTKDVTESTKITTIDEDHPDPTKGDDDDDDESVVNVPCGGKWRERHFEFDLDVSALQERAAEQAERLAEQANRVAEQAGRVAAKVRNAAWRVMHHNVLPEWLRDNDFLVYHHRPPMPSFKKCFRSVFRVHTETGNIWTHLIGLVIFIGLMIYFLVSSLLDSLSWQEILVYMAFFMGAILCLAFSTFFHTCCCHSVAVSKVCSKLDYSGITLLIVGSFVPWLYYGFYCETITRGVYFASICVLGAICLFVAMKDKFGKPKYRPLRAVLFISLGLSAFVPAAHYVITNNFAHAIEAGAVGWMLLMGFLYIGGATLYALRIPERFFPGKCDVWFHSHQFFHVMVVAAAMVHFHGLNTMQAYRESVGECDAEDFVTEIMSTMSS